MNFYIGNFINELDITSENIEFSDELLDFIYKMSNRYSIDMNKLCKINPYDDVEIPKANLPDIIKICNIVLNESMLESYQEKDQGNQMVNDLIQIANKALDSDLGLISIGD